MPQLSDLSTVSVDDAADVLAARIKLASRMEKTALTAAQGAMLGGGLGLGGGLLASTMSKKKDKRYGRNALVGALMGGGLLGLGTGVYNHMQGGPESLADIAGKADQIREQGQGSSGWDRLANRIFGEAAPTSPEEQKAMLAGITDPKLRAIAAQELEAGGDISRHLPSGGLSSGLDTAAGGLADAPGTVAAGTVAGAVGGNVAERKLRAAQNSRGLAQHVTGMLPEEIAKLKVKDRIAANAMQDVHGRGGRIAGETVTNKQRPITSAFTRPPAGGGKTVGMTPGLRSHAVRNTTPKPITGRRGGTLGGFAGGLGTAWLMGGQEPQAAPGQQPLPAGPMSTR